MERIKALGMVSGGLDSTLACKVMLDLGIEVEVVHFLTGFAATHRNRSHGDSQGSARVPEPGPCSDLGVKVHKVDVAKDFLPILFEPKYGYGKNMNPCVDCHAFMLRKMRPLMESTGARFVFTGEVLGQRPMSQHRQALRTVELESGLQGLVLRPLSACLLEPTIPEKEGWVDRSKLLALSGRSRKPQMRLAAERGILKFAQPAGGCLLTEPHFSALLADLLEHRGKGSLTPEDASLLKLGRHFRLSPTVKVIVGRDEEENALLARYENGRHVFRVLDHPCALTLAEAPAPLEGSFLTDAASIAARYCDAPRGTDVRMDHEVAGTRREITARAAEPSVLESWRIT